MRTAGEIEAAVGMAMTRFEQDHMGRGPKNVHAHLIGDLVLVRLEGVLTTAEQQLARSLPPEKGRDLLKQVRTQLIETARPTLSASILEATGQPPISMHHDISTISGEEVIVFVLNQAPPVRELKRR
jgi:uncharacterized protein YbcI